MIVLDAYAVIALLQAEPAAGQVQSLLVAHPKASLTVLGVAEVIHHLIRRVGVEPEEAALDLAQLGLTAPEVLTVQVSMRAGLLRARHYHRRHRAISLADCVVLETARDLGHSVATADPHLLDMCKAEGVATIPLPDMRGTRWQP